MILRWSAPFVPLLADEPRIDRGEPEQVEASARYRTMRLHFLLSGLHPAKVQPTWPGSGVFVVRPVSRNSVHVVSHTKRTAQ